MWQSNHCVVQQGMRQTRQCKKYFDWRAEAVLLTQPGRTGIELKIHLYLAGTICSAAK
jgi:hypothetical protein